MAATTNIEWADGTANFWMGCTKLSPACDWCYAERDWDKRRHRVTWGPHGERVPVKAGDLVIRKHQRHAAAFIAEHGRKPRIFINSLSDFADNHRSIDPRWREAVWQAARDCPDVILMILTKRPQNLPDYLPADWGQGYPNVWIGTTVENQAEADRRREHLRVVPAIVRFVSYEPALGPVDWVGWEFIKWLIAGGESGPNARPSHPDWYRSAQKWTLKAGAAFHFKQWGEWLPRENEHWDYHGDEATVLPDGRVRQWQPDYPHGRLTHPQMRPMIRIGKAKAGRLLDGREWSEFPA